jgi:hypothetical protein
MVRGMQYQDLNMYCGAERRQANVMLAYPIDEAEELLSTKLSAAKKSLSNCEEDLDFLREQITVSHPQPLM